MEKAAPRPVFGALAQSPLHRIAVNVVELLYELFMIANVEIVLALGPDKVTSGAKAHIRFPAYWHE